MILLELQILHKILSEFINNTNHIIQNSTDRNITWIKITTFEPSERDRECENCTNTEYEEQNSDPRSRRKRRKRRRNKKPLMSDRFHKALNQRRKTDEHSQKKYSTRVHLERPIQFFQLAGLPKENEISKIDSNVQQTVFEFTTQAFKNIPAPVQYLLPPFFDECNNDNSSTSIQSFKASSTNTRGSTKFKNTAYYQENEVDYTTFSSDTNGSQQFTIMNTNKSKLKPIVVQPIVEKTQENVNDSQNNGKYRKKFSFVSSEVEKAGMNVMNVMSEFWSPNGQNKQLKNINYSKGQEELMHSQNYTIQQKIHKSSILENYQQSLFKSNGEQFHEKSNMPQIDKSKKQHRESQLFQSQSPVEYNHEPIHSEENQEKNNLKYQILPHSVIQHQKMNLHQQHNQLKDFQQKSNNELLNQQPLILQNHQKMKSFNSEQKQNVELFREWPFTQNYQNVQLEKDSRKLHDRYYEEESNVMPNRQLTNKQIHSQNSEHMEVYPQLQEQLFTNTHEHTTVNSEKEYSQSFPRKSNNRQITSRQMEKDTATSVSYSTNNSISFNIKESNQTFNGLELAESSYFSDLPSYQEISSFIQTGK